MGDCKSKIKNAVKKAEQQQQQQQQQHAQPENMPANTEKLSSNQNILKNSMPFQPNALIMKVAQQQDVLIQLIQQQLLGLSYSEDQLYEIAGQIIKIKYEISAQEKVRQRKKAQSLLGKGEQLDINSMLAEEPQNESMSRVRSRILYSLGNKLAESKSFTFFKIRALNSDQIQQLLRYENIEMEIEKIAQSFYLKEIEIRENTKKIEDLFCLCFQNHHKQLTDPSYFDLDNGLAAAKFSRDACNYDQRGIFIFLNYMVRTLWELESKGKSLSEIQKAAHLFISTLSKLYPPGQDLIGGDEGMRKILNEKEVYWDKQASPLKDNPLIVFSNKKSKMSQLESEVIKRARIAEEELPELQNIIRQNCLKKCIGVDSNLKLYAQKQNQKALVRIIQKLLFKKETTHADSQEIQTQEKFIEEKQKQKIQADFQSIINKMIVKKTGENKGETIQEHLDAEEKKYQAQVEEKLSSKQSIEFTISDMVRGKCIFSKIEDIIETIDKIKKYVRKEHAIHPGRYRILEVESRFTKQIPISDVTLKIALNQRIVAQLQLTLQSNLATYAFAHKIYELERSKVFSKIKTVFNYYYEYKKQFLELLLAQINVSESSANQKSQIISSLGEPVKEFFLIQNSGKRVELSNILKGMQQNRQMLTDPKEWVLVKAIFDRKMLKGIKQRAQLFRKHLPKEEGPETLRAALFYQMIKDIDLTDNIHEICEANDSFYTYLQKIISSDPKQKKKPSITYLQTIKIVLKYQSLERLFGIYKNLQWLPEEEDAELQEEDSEAELEIDGYQGVDPSLKQYEELIQKVFGTGKEKRVWMMNKGKIYEQRSKFQKALILYDRAFDTKNNEEEDLAKNIQLSKARLYIKLKKFKRANKLLQKLLISYKEMKDYNNALICNVLLSESALKSKNRAKFEEYYSNAQKMTEIHKLNFGGTEIANSEYRIGAEMVKKSKSKQEGLDIHLRKAFEEFGMYMHPKILMKKMKQHWPEYAENGIKEPELKINDTLRYFQIFQMDPEGMDPMTFEYISKIKCPNLEIFDIGDIGCEQKICKSLSKCKWPRLLYLNLKYTKMDGKQCQYLAKGNWPELQQLQLNSCQISSQGCEYLKKGKWPNLEWISLADNPIKAEGCKYLVQAKWPKLFSLELWRSQLDGEALKYLSQSKWANLSRLLLSENDINERGCEYLVKAKWPKLFHLDLSSNQIKGPGCVHLSQGQWLYLQQIILVNNQIDDKGYQHLAQGKWPKLKKLDLQYNQLVKGSFESSQWPNLEILLLGENKIDDEGCQSLSQNEWLKLQQLNLAGNNIVTANLKGERWSKLKYLRLNNNKINSEGCENLCKQKWAMVEQLNLCSNQITRVSLDSNKWPEIKIIYLTENKITAQGCEEFNKSNWKNLEQLNIGMNSICDKGCEHISRASCPKLLQLDISQNKITDKGCDYLSKGKWPNLYALNLTTNEVSIKGCQKLAKGKWPKLLRIQLYDNIIEESKKCKQILKGAFSNIAVEIDEDDLGYDGC